MLELENILHPLPLPLSFLSCQTRQFLDILLQYYFYFIYLAKKTVKIDNTGKGEYIFVTNLTINYAQSSLQAVSHFIFFTKLTPIHLYRFPNIFSCPVIDDLRGDVDVDLLTNYSLLSRVRSLDLTRVMPAGCQPALRLNCLHFYSHDYYLSHFYPGLLRVSENILIAEIINYLAPSRFLFIFADERVVSTLSTMKRKYLNLRLWRKFENNIL